jgi:hypothetical protein
MRLLRRASLQPLSAALLSPARIIEDPRTCRNERQTQALRDTLEGPDRHRLFACSAHRALQPIEAASAADPGKQRLALVPGITDILTRARVVDRSR